MRDRIAAAVLIDGDRVLLCLRSRTRRWCPGVWDLPGGHVEDCESPATALSRELREELGITARAGRPAAHVETDDYEIDVFVVHEWDGAIRNRAPDEHDKLAFVTLAEAARLDLADAHLLPLLTRVMATESGITRPTAPERISTTPNAPWLPPGNRADAVYSPGGAAPAPTGLVRLLIQRGDHVFCVARDDTGKPDLPTRTVPDLDDGRTTAELLTRDILGEPAAVTLVGFIRNIVDTPDADYPWPTPNAHFSVWAAHGEPRIQGQWLSISDQESPLRDRHWWPIATHANTA
ncbi:NUDIX domain-containing protein [Xylanimonas ulmi]|uniref:8-oxo-dGTP diphosphatase n=1 Tax=Xylanimonas ulmi TaxID=228973 RepID=A0A4V2EXU1_9MICO|nr:NUDIX domain-containing protein [Xylanibacterium ulmi]RZS60670.1 ADP-ribose pyrophosphatase YjhB (NUDIX family) [Xylanibacterium ulmi]